MSDSEKFRFTVVGAGAIGLSIARTLSERFQGDTDVLVVEKEPTFGRGISSRNSEVIHSGIYYPTGSLKHRLCVEGRTMLYEYCETHAVPFRKCGKLIVAADAGEIRALEQLQRQAAANQIEHVAMLDRGQARALEPEVNVEAALLLEETGIFDSHTFMKSLEQAVVRKNGTVLYGSELCSLQRRGAGYALELRDGTTFESECVINSAGLHCTTVSKLLGIEPEILYPCKGSYFAYTGRHSCTRLVYPVPHASLTGLGVHATIDLGGRLRFGPDVEYVTTIDDYGVDAGRKESFCAAAKKLFPHLAPEHMVADMAGIRPKIQGPGDAVRDFYIADEKDCGFPGFINLLGMESPGLTAALAIGEYVARLAGNA